jgi:uncharacterized HAD superfamily protein
MRKVFKEDRLRVTMDNRVKILEEIWKRQKEFNDNFHDPDKTSLKEKQDHTKEISLHLISEVYEVLREMNWKLHRRESIDEVRTDKIEEELIDVFKYWLTLAQIWGMTPESFVQQFYRKSEVVEQKYKQEFSLKLLEDENVIGVDIDGVLCNYPEDFVKFMERETGKDLSSFTLKEYNLYSALGEILGEKTIRELKHKFRISGEKSNLSVVKGAREGLSFLKSKGYTIVLLTARPYKEYPRMFADTMEWLKKNELPYDAILWDEDKLSKITREFPKINFMIEDHLGNSEKIARKGYKVFLIDKTYNQGETDKNIKRVSGWREIVEDIENA